MTEAQIQAEILKFLKDNKIFHFRVNADSTTVGIPDIVACYRGRFIGIEVKAKEGRPTCIQDVVREKILDSKGSHVYARSVDDVAEVLIAIRLNEEHKY